MPHVTSHNSELVQQGLQIFNLGKKHTAKVVVLKV